MKVLHVASRGSKNILVKNQGDSLINKNMEVDYFSLEKGLINYFKSIFEIRKYKKLNNFDIVHCHYGLAGIVVILAHLRCPIVISFMGDDVLGTLNKRYKYTLISKLFSKLNIFLANYYYDFTIVKSDNMYKKMGAIKNISVIPNGVNLNMFYPIEKISARKSLKWDIEKKYVLFVSDPCREEKNYKLAKEAVSIVNNKHIILYVVNKVYFTELSKYYSAGDILLLTSLHEGSPNVVKEAMACNCPIVSTDVGDVKWVIGNTEGCFIASNDSNSVAKKIELALEYTRIYDRTNGRDRIKKINLDSDSIADSLVETYNRFIESKR